MGIVRGEEAGRIFSHFRDGERGREEVLTTGGTAGVWDGAVQGPRLKDQAVLGSYGSDGSRSIVHSQVGGRKQQNQA